MDAGRDTHLKDKQTRFDLDIVSQYRAAIYGLCSLWIVFFHGYAVDKVDYTFGKESLTWLAGFINRGNVGVDIFLFLSGISLFYSWNRNSDLQNYFVKRVTRLLIPVLIINGAYWAYVYLIQGQGNGITSFISCITLNAFWTTGKQQIYYVELLLILYLLYPYIHALLFSGKGLHTALVVAGMNLLTVMVIVSFYYNAPDLYDMVEIAITRIPVFLVGCAMGRVVYQGVQLPSYAAILPFAGVVLFFYGLYVFSLTGPWWRFFYLIGGVSLAYTFAIVFRCLDHIVQKFFNRKSRFLSLIESCGDFSLEIYLSHITVNQIYKMTPLYVQGDFGRYCVVAVISVAAAGVLSKFLIKPLSKRMISVLARPVE